MGEYATSMPDRISLERLFYTYKEVGTVDKEGVKYKKYVKVPRFRSKHKAALGRAVDRKSVV